MKKIITTLLTLILMTTFVFAQGNGMQWQETHPSVSGLENAMFRVQNEEQEQHLEQVMNMIQEKHRERINQLDELIIEADEDGEVTVEGLGRGKFLGLVNLGYRYQYDMNEETGELVRVQKPWDFLFSDLDEQLEVEG